MGFKRRYVRWDRLDNTAHLFPVIAGESMTNTYRLSTVLESEVDGALLQQALDMNRPVLVNCHIGMDVNVLPMVPAGASITHPILEISK